MLRRKYRFELQELKQYKDATNILKALSDNGSTKKEIMDLLNINEKRLRNALSFLKRHDYICKSSCYFGKDGKYFLTIKGIFAL